jgi:hypothetical protein
VEDWSAVAKTCFFFGAKFYPREFNMNHHNFDAFAIAFPFGCYHDPMKIQWDAAIHSENDLIKWCEGVLFTPQVLDMVFYKARDIIFERFLVELPKMQFSRYEMCDILNWIQLKADLSCETGKPPNAAVLKRRATQTIVVLSQMLGYAENDGLPLDEIIYPCLAKWHYRFYRGSPDANSRDLLKMTIPRPKWSKERHLKLCSNTTFGQTALTILLIQKNPQENCFFLRDLVPTILACAFDAHVAHLEETLGRRTENFTQWWNARPSGHIAELGLSYGIVIAETPQGLNALDAMSDIYDIVQGLLIHPKRKDLYRQTFVQLLLQAERSSILQIIKKVNPSGVLLNDYPIVGTAFLDYCEEQKIPLAKVYRGEYVFTETDLDALVLLVRNLP